MLGDTLAQVVLDIEPGLPLYEVFYQLIEVVFQPKYLCL